MTSYQNQIDTIRVMLKSQVNQDEHVQVDEYVDQLECEDDVTSPTDIERLEDFRLYQSIVN